MKKYYLENEGGKVFYREYEDGKMTRQYECDTRPEAMNTGKDGSKYIVLREKFDNPTRGSVKISFVANPGDSYEVKPLDRSTPSQKSTTKAPAKDWASTLVNYLEFKAQGPEGFAKSLDENPLWFNYLSKEDMEEFKKQFLNKAKANAKELYPIELDNIKEQLLNELPDDKKGTFEAILK